MNICYTSKSNLNIFPKNNGFKFSSCIHNDKIIFDETLEEVGIKQISIDCSVLKECRGSDVLGIKSNICLNNMVSSSNNSLLCIFTLKNTKIQKQETSVITFQNPIYFSSFKSNLSNAQFEIWNLGKH